MANPISIAFPLQPSPQGAFATNNTTLAAATDDLIILILSNYGERPCVYNFGANLRSLVFEQETNIQQRAKDLIMTAVNTWMPFVSITSLIIDTADSNINLLEN